MSSVNSSIQNKLTQLWESNLANASIINSKLAGVNTRIETIEANIDQQLESALNHINMDTPLAAFKALLTTTEVSKITVKLAPLYTAINEIDPNDSYTFLYAYQELSTLLKEVLAQLIEGDADTLEQVLDAIEYTLEDILDAYELIDQYDETETLTFILQLKQLVFKFIGQLADFGVKSSDVQAIQKAVNPIFNIISLAIYKNIQTQEEEENNLLGVAHIPPVAKASLAVAVAGNKPEERPATTPEEVIENIDHHFTEIVHEINSLPVLDTMSLKETELKDIWEFGLNFAKSLEEDDMHDIEEALYTINEKIDELLEFISKKIAPKNPEISSFISNTLQPQIDRWFELPDDFRPNNWVEVIHLIVQKIQYSLKDNTQGSGGAMAMFVSFFNKLESILSTVDNDSFKLLITPKEDPKINNIDIPNILEEEEEEEALLAGSLNSEATPLTIGSILHFLCFDKTHGATAKLDAQYSEIIEDLYYNTWLNNHIEYLEYNFSDFFSEEKFAPILTEIKDKLLNEEGVNIGEFLNYIIDKFTAIVKEGIALVKDSIHYIIDELFALVKAIIAFFKDVDLPPAVMAELKKLPPFKNMPKDVTLLHIIAAIPYTIVTEFINYEVPETVKTKVA